MGVVGRVYSFDDRHGILASLHGQHQGFSIQNTVACFHLVSLLANHSSPANLDSQVSQYALQHASIVRVWQLEIRLLTICLVSEPVAQAIPVFKAPFPLPCSNESFDLSLHENPLHDENYVVRLVDAGGSDGYV